MKKIIICIVAVAVVAAAAVGAYFAFFNNGPENTAELSITKNDFSESMSYLEALIRNPDRYQKALANEFEMGDEVAAEFYAAPEEWLSYQQTVTVKNIGENDLTIYGYEVKNNGKDGVYISTKSTGEIGIAPGGNAPTVLSILCSDGELSTDEVKAIVDSMEISVVYTKTPVEYDDGTESVEETKTAVISASEGTEK